MIKNKSSKEDDRNKPPDKTRVEKNNKVSKNNKDKNKKTVLNKADLEKIEKYEKYLTTFRVNNTSNESVVINEVINENINKLVCRVNKIDIHTYHFFKYYCIYHFYKYDSLPKIDDGFIRSIMKTITSKNDTRGRSATKESQKDLVKLESFYNNYYKHTIIESDKVTREGLTNQFMYESEKIITCLTNHISSNFQSSLNRYINILIDMNEIKKHVREQDKIGNHTIGNKRATNSDINYSFKKLKNDIFKNKNKASPIYDKFKLIFKSKILKDFQVEKSLENHLKKDPLSLLILFIRISIEAEKIEIERQLPENKGKPIKAINCFPLRKSITPKYIKLDTRTVVETLLPEKERKLYRLSQSEKYDEIWSKFFKIGDKIFSKNGYKWNRNIMTNGVSSSVLFIREDKYNSDKQNKIKTMQKPFGYVEFKNIATLTPDQMKKIGFLSGKKYVGIDPGKGILIFCTDGKVTLVRKKSGKIHRKTNIFRYTNANRKFETKVKLNRKRLERMKAGKGDIETSILKDTIKYQERKLYKINNVKRPNDISIKKYEDDKKNLVKLIEDNKNKLDKKVYLDKFNRSDLILGETVKHYENMLSGISASSCLWNNVQKYIHTKNLVNYILFEFYERKIHRQNRWHQFINKQRADANMIKRFKDKFGPPEDVVIFMGNWSEGKPMKYQEPSKGKSIRRLFRRNGYEVLLVSEYNTSQKMYGTGAQLENFRKHEDKTKTRRQKIREKQKKKKQANKKIGKDNDKNKTEIKQNKKQKTDYVHRIVGSTFLKSYGDKTMKEAKLFIKYMFDGNTRGAVDIINRDLNGSLNILLRAIFTMLYGDEGIPWYLKYQAKKVRPRITIEDLYGIEKIIFNKQVLDMAKEITASSSIIKKNEKDKKIEKIVGKRSNKVERKGKSRLLKVVPTKNVKLNDKDNQIKSKIHISMKSILNKEKMDRKTRGKVRANYNRSTKVTKTVKPGFSYTISSDSESIN